MKKKTIWIIAGIVAAIFLVIVILPFVIDANQFRPRIQSELSASLNRKVGIGNISLSILSGGVAVNDVTISDDPAFSREPFLKAKSVTVGVELIPLIFSKQLHVTAFTIVEPEVTMLRAANGTWNYSSLGAGNKKTASADDNGASFTVQKLAINSGKLLVGNVGANSKRREYDDLNLKASGLSYESQFPFTLTAKAPGNAKLKLDGKAGPLNRSNTEETPIDANLKVEHFDLGATGFTDPTSGLGGLLDFAGTLSSNGRKANSKGKIEANNLQLVAGGSPARVPVNIQDDTDYELKTAAGVLRQGDVRIGKALARLSGNYNAAGETTSILMKLTGQDMPVQDLESLLPALGVALPSGSSLQSGTVTANLDIRGPVDRLVTTGPVNLSNGKLAHFDLGSKLGALSAFTGIAKGSDTTIQLLSSSVQVAPAGTRVDNLNLIVPAIGTLTGNGTIGANHELNFRMLAKLNSGGQNAMSGIAAMAGLGQNNGQSGNGIPFMIQGTTSNPVFVPDVAGMASGFMKGKMSGLPNSGTPKQPDVGGLLQGLLGKKKKP